jgi:glyoxylase-like metal-dependent hydrolase (beta-lactamase superfamily II)
MGLIVRDGKCLLLDTGLDKDAARQALRAVEEVEAALEAVLITHAHADHFGGTNFLQRRTHVPVYAPALEAAMMEHPIMEPLFLFGGAAPIRELRSKFTMAKPCRIDQIVEPGPQEIGPFQVDIVALPGHALGQIGLAVGRGLFCADALFPEETLTKHKVMFCVDLEQTLQVLQELPAMDYEWFAPGHGPAYASGSEISGACDLNRRLLTEIRDTVLEELEEGQRTAEVVRAVADQVGLQISNATAFFLTRTTILAALSGLEKEGRVRASVEDNTLRWHRLDA